MYSFINYVSVALEHKSFLDNDSCRAIHFVATLNLHFGTTGLGVVHVLLLLSTLCSFLFVPFVAFRAVIAIENVYSRKHNVPVCHSSAPQKELQGSLTAVCIPSVQRVALEMLERFFCYCFFKCVINGHLFVHVIIIMLTSLTKLFRTTVHRERISSLLFEHIQNFPHNLRVINGDNGM